MRHLLPAASHCRRDVLSSAGRSAERRQPLRFAHRAWPHGRHRRHSAYALSSFTVLGELGLDGSIAAVAGVLSAAIAANGRGQGLICPYACGSEAAWASPEIEIVAAQSLIQLANHFKGTQVLARPHPKIRERDSIALDLADIARGCCRWRAQSADDRFPGAGKSMLAARLPTILPPLSPTELLEVSMIASIAGEIDNGALTNSRPSESAAHASGPSANDCRQRSSGFRILAGGARSGCSLRPGCYGCADAGDGRPGSGTTDPCGRSARRGCEDLYARAYGQRTGRPPRGRALRRPGWPPHQTAQSRASARGAKRRVSARFRPACSLTRVSPHCHNSVVGPWCTGQRQSIADSPV